MLETTGIAKGGLYKLDPKQDELLTSFLIDCDGQFVRTKWTKVGSYRTSKQLRTHFGLAIARIRQAMIDQGITVCGVTPNKDMIHEILSLSCGGVGPLGETKRLSQMTIDEACKFFENIRDWAATQLHCVIPEPNPEWRKAGQ